MAAATSINHDVWYFHKICILAHHRVLGQCGGVVKSVTSFETVTVSLDSGSKEGSPDLWARNLRVQVCEMVVGSWLTLAWINRWVIKPLWCKHSGTFQFPSSHLCFWGPVYMLHYEFHHSPEAPDLSVLSLKKELILLRVIWDLAVLYYFYASALLPVCSPEPAFWYHSCSVQGLCNICNNISILLANKQYCTACLASTWSLVTFPIVLCCFSFPAVGL